MVHDPFFVKTVQYADELVGTIPARKRLDVLIELYRAKKWKLAPNIRVIFNPLLSKLLDNEINEFLLVVSDDLKTAKNASEVSLIISIIDHELWSKIQMIPKMSAENILLQELSNAWYIPNRDKNNSPESPWISNIAKYFTLKDELQIVIKSNLDHEDFHRHNFIVKYYMHILPDIFNTELSTEYCIWSISKSIN